MYSHSISGIMGEVIVMIFGTPGEQVLFPLQETVEFWVVGTPCWTTVEIIGYRTK